MLEHFINIFSIFIYLVLSLLKGTLAVAFAIFILSIFTLQFGFALFAVALAPFAFAYAFPSLIIFAFPTCILLHYLKIKNRMIWLSMGLILGSVSFAIMTLLNLFSFDDYPFILLAIAIGVATSSFMHKRMLEML